MVPARAVAGRFALIVATGLGLGVLVGGVLGRLMMFVLARLNPENTGALSDDGFAMGQFTLSGSVNLLVAGAFLGTFGALVYAGARHLTFGPRWFRALSVVLGAGLPVGASIVHTEGVDFTLLQPALLAIAMFVAIPALYGAGMYAVLERRLPAPARSWQSLEPLRWLLRAGATAVLVVALLDLVSDARVLA